MERASISPADVSNATAAPDKGAHSTIRSPLVDLQMPVELFLAFLRDAPTDIPAYSVSVLPDKDAADIYAFLRSLPGRKPVRDIPLLSQ